MDLKTTVLINTAGGTAKDPQATADLQALLAAQLPAAAVEMVREGDDLTERAQAACAQGAQIVAVAGGDGSLNAAAQSLVGTSVRLGVLPFGTFNHFARDAGVPLDLPKAVELLRGGDARRIDVGAVNDRYFLNNASLGLYPELVQLREHESHALSKPLRLLEATWQITRTAKPLPLQIDDAGGLAHVRVWLIFVGNNFYQLGIFRRRHRTRLDAAKLDVFEVRARRRVEIAQVLLHALRTGLRLRNVVHRELTTITVRPVGTPHAPVAFDGEVADMPGPFTFRSVPQSLWVVAPPAP